MRRTHTHTHRILVYLFIWRETEKGEQRIWGWMYCTYIDEWSLPSPFALEEHKEKDGFLHMCASLKSLYAVIVIITTSVVVTISPAKSPLFILM